MVFKNLIIVHEFCLLLMDIGSTYVRKRYLGTVFLWFFGIIDQQWHLFVYDMSPFGHKINQNWFPHQCSSHWHWLQSGKSKSHSNTLSGKMLKTHEICRVLCFIHICISCPYFLNLSISPPLNQQDVQPRTVIALWNAEIEEPNFNRPDPEVTIFDQSTSKSYSWLLVVAIIFLLFIESCHRCACLRVSPMI